MHYDAVVPNANPKDLKSNVGQDCCRVEAILTDEDMPTGDPTTKQLGKLKIIFWNSNGWDQERCDKISEVALEEESDVICIQDARMHPCKGWTHERL